MTHNRPSPSDVAATIGELSPNLTARMLAAELGGTAALWVHRLANWRRPGRKSELPFIPGESPTYAYGDVQEFIAKERAKRVVLADRAGTAEVRAGATAHLDGTGAPEVRVMFATGAVTQSVFALSPQSARQLADLLVRSASVVERATAQAQEVDSES